MSALNRSRYKELSESNLMKRTGEKTKLSTAFHIADLLGMGDINAIDTPGGRFIRKNKE